MKTLVAAIEFGTSKIVTVVGRSDSRNRIEVISCSKVEYSGYRDGDWVDRKDVQQSIYNSIVAAQSEIGQKINEVYIGVPCEFIHVSKAEATVRCTGEDGRVAHEDIENLQDLAAEKFNFASSGDTVIHRSPCWFSRDKKPREISVDGKSCEYLEGCISFITVVDYFVDDMREILGQVGITINGFLSPTLAQVLIAADGKERDRSCILLDCGMYNTEFSAVKGDGIYYHAVLPFGGNDITDAIAEGLGVNYDEAESLKYEASIRDFDDVSAHSTSRENDKVDEICTSKLDELCEYIKRTEEEVTGAIVPRSAIYLSGGGIALLRGGREYLEAYMDRKVYTVEFNGLKVGGPEYASAITLIEMIFDAIESKPVKTSSFADDDALPGRALAGLRGLFGKK